MCARSSYQTNNLQTQPQRRGFTLVELLVVIGIIALLISILLPSLNRARQAAKQVSCLSQMRQIGTAMTMHAQEHSGYMQIAGLVEVEATPEGLGDPRMRRYSYFKDGTMRRPMSLAGALSPYLGRRMREDSYANMEDDQTKDESSHFVARKIFSCPGEATPKTSITLRTNTPAKWYAPPMYSSYGFNEAILNYKKYGGTDARAFNGLRGHLSAIKQPSRTVLLCDQFARTGGANLSWFTIYANYAPSTLEEAFFGQNGAGPSLAADKAWDLTRHNGRVNWLAADMHAETAVLPRANATYSANGPLSDIFIITKQ